MTTVVLKLFAGQATPLWGA